VTAALPLLSALGRAAVKYAEHGWYVFPLVPRQKEPLVAKGFLSATNDLEQVRAWWIRNPNANIGLWPGQSGLVVLDLDGPDGVAAAQRLGVLSEPTLECSTGRAEGGRHLYFKRPTFTVSNCELAPKLDVRGDAGYVVLPPSVHPTGRAYAWAGRVEDIKELTAEATAAIYSRQLGSLSGSADTQAKARDIVFEDALDEGGRNNALTRYAGRLLAKQVPEDEVLVVVSAINVAKCKPPLPQDEVNTLVASISRKENSKNVRLVTNETTPPAIPSPRELALEQIEGARAMLTRDVSQAPRWAWYDVDKLTGPMLPGDLIVVGALMGNGKSTLLMSQMDAFAAAKKSTLYIPLEIDAKVCRLRWAAWKLGLEVKHAIRQDWSRLPEGAQEAIDGVLEEQERGSYIHFARPKRMTFSTLIDWCRWSVEEAGASTVMLDHFHRLDFGSGAQFRIEVTEAARRLKDLARELNVVMIAAAQLNRASSDPIDQYCPPQLGRLKESGGIGEEADVVLMLSRRLKRDLPNHWTQDLRLGRLSEVDLAEPSTMVVTCRKHRLDDSALNCSAYLNVRNGKLENRSKWSGAA